METKKLITLLVPVILAMVAWFVPAETFGIPNLTVVEQRVIGIFLLAVALWITEPIPVWTTSILVIVVMLLTTSDSMFAFLNYSDDASVNFGQAISYKAIMATWANPIIMLFMGGFILAITASKYKMDAGLAKFLLKPFGKKSHIVMLGFIFVTAIFSMFMSNTATAAMMLTILTPVLATLPPEGKGRVGLALSIPIAANVGGIGTPIGTPPNAIAVGYLAENGYDISFVQWMNLMVPFVIILLIFSWLLLLKMFPFTQKEIVVEIEGEFEKSPKAYIAYITFAVTILLWVTGELTDLNANVVALIPVGVLTVTGVITKEDLRKIDWDVLWLVAGGFALGVGLDKTGLAKHLVETIPFDTWMPILVLIGSGILCCLMSTFMSHSGTAAFLVPILATVGNGMKDQLESLGGVPALLIGVALSASLAMALPISTPPNALAYAKGFILQKDMAITGIIVGVVGIALGYAFLIFVGTEI